MAVTWANHDAAYSKLLPAIKDFSAKACVAQLAIFDQHHENHRRTGMTSGGRPN